MKNILIIAVNTLRLIFRKKSNIIAFLILPVALVVISMLLFGSASSAATRVGVSNMDNGKLSEEMVKSFEAAEKFNIIAVGEDAVKDMVAEGKVDCVLVIPPGFTEAVYKGNKVELKLISVRGEDVTAWIENYSNLYMVNLLDIAKASAGSKENFHEIYEGFKLGSLKVEIEKLEDITNSKGITSQAVGFLIMFMMIAATITSTLILKEKKNRTYFRILSAPVNAKTYMLGNVAANMVIVAIQSVLVIAGITKLVGINTFIPNWQLFIILICFGLVSIGFGLLIVAFSETTVQAGNLSTLIITPTCMIGGCFWPVEFMPQTLQNLSYFMPQRWVIQAISRLQTGGSFNDILTNLGVVIAFAAAFFIIAAYRFRNLDNVKNFI
jgi:ABC-2 type transport system permease protein